MIFPTGCHILKSHEGLAQAIAWLDPHEAASYHCWLPRIAPWRRSPLLKSARCLEEADLDEVSACLLACLLFSTSRIPRKWSGFFLPVLTGYRVSHSSFATLCLTLLKCSRRYPGLHSIVRVLLLCLPHTAQFQWRSRPNFSFEADVFEAFSGLLGLCLYICWRLTDSCSMQKVQK